MTCLTATRYHRLVSIGLALFLASALLQLPGFASASELSGGSVLPPDATPHGYSLNRIAVATAGFNANVDAAGNHIGSQPNIPFRMLVTTATNTFSVGEGTLLYVPLGQADDSPPILGTFPTKTSQASGYFFGQSQLGAHDFRITVDGRTTPIGPAYLVGPVTTPPLPDGGGTHYMTLAVFLSPLNEGAHAVTIEGHFSGAAVTGFFGRTFDFVIPYTVKVQ